MKRYSLVILACCLLQGCMGTSLSGSNDKSTQDKRSASTMFDDEDISYRANQRLAGDTQIANQCHIVVATFNHHLLATGQAPNEAMRTTAIQTIKEGDPKIKTVYDQITLTQPTSGVVRSNDALITTNVKARMYATTNLSANNFKVVTEDSVVYIMGKSTHAQADIAAEIARNSTGVKKVVKVVEYTG